MRMSFRQALDRAVGIRRCRRMMVTSASADIESCACRILAVNEIETFNQIATLTTSQRTSTVWISHIGQNLALLEASAKKIFLVYEARAWPMRKGPLAVDIVARAWNHARNVLIVWEARVRLAARER